MSWFVLTEGELQHIEQTGHTDLADHLRENGDWTEDDTLLTKPDGPKAAALVGAFDRLPRRLASDPPTDTRPSQDRLRGMDE